MLDRTNQVVVAKGLLFKDLYDAYIADYKNKGRSPSTVRNIAFSYRKKYARFENVRITKINDYDLIEWIEDLKKDLSPNTVRIREGALSAFFNWCIRKKHLIETPLYILIKLKQPSLNLNFGTNHSLINLFQMFRTKNTRLLFAPYFILDCERENFADLAYPI